MPLQIVRNDITRMQVDAIVNPSDERLSGAGGVDAAIHRAAGSGLRAACDVLGHCRVGEVQVTSAYALPCRYVFHTAGPIWQGGHCGEAAQLAACYENALIMAVAMECSSIAIPLIASGAFGFPRDAALRVATDSISRFLATHELTVWLVVFDRAAYQISSARFADIAAFIDDTYARQHADLRRMRPATPMSQAPAAVSPAVPARCKAAAASLDDALKMLDESFSEMLLRKIDEKGMKDAQCYKKANIDRKLFSKIRSDKHYRPSKPTVLAFAIALELPLQETQELLMKAGFALSHSNKFDIIVEYFIRQGNYNIFEINEALFAFDQSLLGG